MITLYALAAAVGIGVLWLGTNIKVIKQFERGVVFRFGRVQSGLRGPGLTMLIPIADRLEKVNMQGASWGLGWELSTPISDPSTRWLSTGVAARCEPGVSRAEQNTQYGAYGGAGNGGHHAI